MTIHRDTFQVYKTYGGTDYFLDGTSGILISWRNVFGNLINSVEADTNSMLSAGIYEITVDPTTYDLRGTYLLINVASSSYHNLLGPYVDTSNVVIRVGYATAQTGIIPGLALKFNGWSQIQKTDKVHVIVGGRWVADEDRYLEDLMFGELSSSGPATDSVTLTVKNNSAYTLTSIEAKVVNKVSINQINMSRDDACIAAWGQISSHYGTTYVTNPYDIITEMTAADTPSPIKAYNKVNGNTEVWELFSRSASIVYCYGYPSTPYSVTPPWIAYRNTNSNDILSAYIYESHTISEVYNLINTNDINSITYDFGKGVFKCANMIAVWDMAYFNFYLYGSADDTEIPASWDLLCYSSHAYGTYTSRNYYLGGNLHNVKYFYFKNDKEYRHFKFAPYGMMAEGETSPWYAQMSRIELLNVPLTTYYLVENYKPFTSINRNYSTNPIFDEYSNYPVKITFQNLVSNTIDIYVNEKQYDVYNVATGEIVDKGIGLACDGTTEYVFADDMDYSGLSFKLNSSIQESWSANLYMSNGSGVFEIRSDTDNAWSEKGQKVAVADTLDPSETFSLYVRANPSLDIVNPSSYPVEGLIEVVGWSELQTSLFSGTMTASTGVTAGYTSMRVVVGPFDYSGTKIRIKFANTSNQISNVYFGPQSITSSFGYGKINVTFDEGAMYSTDTTDIWTDWINFDFAPGVMYLVSYEGLYNDAELAYKNSSYATNSSYLLPKGTSHIDDYDYSIHGNYERTLSCLGILEIQIIQEEQHIITLPLSAVVRDKIPSFTMNVNIIDEKTANTLRDFGITIGEVS